MDEKSSRDSTFDLDGVSAEKRGQWRAIFNKIDLNHDGGISLNELVEAIKNNPSLASELHKHLGLPKRVANPLAGQQEGSEGRDAVVQAFTEMDKMDRIPLTLKNSPRHCRSTCS